MRLNQGVQFVIHDNIGAVSVIIDAFFHPFKLFSVFANSALNPIDYLEMIMALCVYIILYD